MKWGVALESLDRQLLIATVYTRGANGDTDYLEPIKHGLVVFNGKRFWLGGRCYIRAQNVSGHARTQSTK